MVMTNQQLLTKMDDHITAIGASMATQMNNQSLCQIQKDGRITGGLKYDEGRLETLQTFRRLIAEHLEQSPELIYAEVMRREAQLQKFQQQSRPSIQWLAYWSGAVEMAHEILAWMDSSRAL